MKYILYVGLFGLALFANETVEETSFFGILFQWIVILLVLGIVVISYFNKFKEIIKGGNSSTKKTEKIKIIGAKMSNKSSATVKTSKGTFTINPIIGIENWTNENIVVRRKTAGSKDAIDTYNAKGSRIDSYLEN